MSTIETAQQWDDEWWRLWEVAREGKLDGEASAGVADREKSERHGPRPIDWAAAFGVSMRDVRAPAAATFGAVSMDEVLAAYSTPLALVGVDDRKSIKLTRWQRAELAARYPEPERLYGRGLSREVAALTGLPIELVETEAESDLPMFVPPPVRIERERGWLGRWLDRVFG